MMRRASVLAVAVAAAVPAWGCLIQTTRVADPAPLFRQARSEAARFAGQPGPARELNVLVWDDSDSQLVRVSLPMGMVRLLARHSDLHCDGDWDWEGDLDLDCERADRIHRHVRGRVRLEDLDRMGLGIVAEVEGDDGERVLVWLRCAARRGGEWAGGRTANAWRRWRAATATPCPRSWSATTIGCTGWRSATSATARRRWRPCRRPSCACSGARRGGIRGESPRNG